ncbi:MAG: cellulose synthase operon protein YhjQ/BcsQ [Planctomycetaceae bacterium]
MIDATPGLGNLDLLCGLNCYWNLSHVISGARELSDVVTAGPAGIDVVVGANDLSQLEGLPHAAIEDLKQQLVLLEQNYDFVLFDAGNALHSSTRPLLSLADQFLVVTTSDPTAIADAYASIKRLATINPCPIEVLVNQVHDAAHSAKIFERIESTSRLFVQTRVQFAGSVSFDEQMQQATWKRTPLLNFAPESEAAEQIRSIGKRLLSSIIPNSESTNGNWRDRLSGFFGMKKE